MKIDRSLYWTDMNPMLDYDHAPCPVCGAIDLAAASRLCKDDETPCKLRCLPWDKNGAFCAPVAPDAK